MRYRESCGSIKSRRVFRIHSQIEDSIKRSTKEHSSGWTSSKAAEYYKIEKNEINFISQEKSLIYFSYTPIRWWDQLFSPDLLFPTFSIYFSQIKIKDRFLRFFLISLLSIELTLYLSNNNWFLHPSIHNYTF